MHTAETIGPLDDLALPQRWRALTVLAVAQLLVHVTLVQRRGGVARAPC